MCASVVSVCVCVFVQVTPVSCLPSDVPVFTPRLLINREKVNVCVFMSGCMLMRRGFCVCVCLPLSQVGVALPGSDSWGEFADFLFDDVRLPDLVCAAGVLCVW